MFHLTLKLKKYRDGRAGYGISLLYRFILSGISLVILLALLLSATEVKAIFTSRNIIPILFASLSLLAVLYKEVWIFDKNKGRISYQTGLLFLFKTKIFCLSSIKAIELAHYRKGGDVKSFLAKLPGMQVWTLSLSFHDDKRITMETHTSSAGRSLVQTGKSIAGFCRVPFVENDISLQDYGSK